MSAIGDLQMCEIWSDGGRRYRLVDPQIVSYARSEERKVDGKLATVSLPPLQFTVVTAEMVGDDAEGETV